MKGKFTKLMMVAMMLVTVFGLAASLATVSSTATVSAATDKWSRMDLPTTLNYQMFPDSDIWDLTGADDGTLFALVEDTTNVDIVAGGPGVAPVWDGLRWAVYPAYSDIALFKSTDGGCSWSLCWHVPSSETGAPIAVVPQPGYKDGDSANDTIFVAMGARYCTGLAGDAPGNYYGVAAAPVPGIPGVGNIYRSMDGCASFTRITPRCPGVTAGGSITSIAVAQCPVCSTGCQDPNMAIVGVSGFGTFGVGEGAYTFNQNGVAIWNDLQVSNAMQAPPTPGTLPAGNGIDVVQVYVSRNWATDGCIIAVVNDHFNTVANVAPFGVGTFVCFYDANDGIWGGDIDSPTNAQRGAAAIPSWVGNYIGAAAVDTGTDFNNVGACYVFVGFDGSTAWPAGAVPSNDNLWRVRGLATVTGPSTITSCNVDALLYGNPAILGGAISDVMINAECSNPQTAVNVACDLPLGQAQVLCVYNSVSWPGPIPSMKPMSGAWPTFITDAAGVVYAAGGGDGLTTSGVHKVYVSSRGPVFNGVGLMDDIAVSEDIPGYASPWYGTWCLVEAVSEDVSPLYDSDGLIYVATCSEWGSDQGGALFSLSLWRLTSGCWERIMYENIMGPDAIVFNGKPMLTTAGIANFVYDWTWWPRVVPQFSTDQSMFLLGGRTDVIAANYREMIWYSPDKGNDWRRLPQMPIGALGWMPGAAGLDEPGWWVQDNNTLFMGDDGGTIYKTTNRGASWTEGVATGGGLEITMIRTSPIYSETGAAGTDKVLIAGTYDQAGWTDEVWISQDGAYSKDLENIGDEIYTSPTPGTWAIPAPLGGTVVNFDKNWATNHIVYAASGGWLDRWELVGLGGGGNIDMNRIDYTDVVVARTEVDLSDPSASTWEDLWNANDYNSIAPKPQTLTGMVLGTSVYRIALPSMLSIGPDGTVYVAFSIWDSSYNNGTAASFGPGDNPSPNAGGRWTMGGVLRCLDGTAINAEFEPCQDGRGTWDGLWLNRAVPGSTHLISLTWDWKEWRFKLAFWEDTLAGSGPAASGPADGATGVGSIMADTSISAPISWAAQTNADLYEWQVSEDAAFTSPKTGTTSGTAATVSGLQAQTTYFWRVRAAEPMLGRWSTVQEFTTVPGGDTGAPKAGKPEDGSTITDTTPLFTWAKIASATNYEIQVATDPGFGAADIVIDETLGDVSAYEADKELVNGTYYWQVRGTNPATDTESPWSFGSFTLDTGAGGAGTPVWVWVLIIVGIVLAIIVIVLILRTRRPV